MTLYIVRHGQTEENLERILQGHLPGKLTQEGRQQVKRTAERLAQEGTNFKCILTSDLKRAMDSADILAERLHLPVIPMEILRERDWGNYTGLSQAEAKDKYKVDGKWVFPDGSAESEQKIYQRARLALLRLWEQYANDTVIVVTHGQFARNLIAAQLNCPCQEVVQFVNAEVRVLHFQM